MRSTATKNKKDNRSYRGYGNVTMNELHNQTSPYLIQHASNPVHWKPWGDEALSLAREQDKLILLSSGYSACHWCHVMEHESFEKDEVAEVMNADFVCIKLDREERPDVDAVYMKAIQLMGSHGGWPMNVICLPDGRPVWGGTYFPQKQWVENLKQLAAMYREDQPKMLEYAGKLEQGLQAMSIYEFNEPAPLHPDVLAPLIAKWKKSFDDEFGGYARAPKFMMPHNYAFMLRYGHTYQDQDLLDHAHLTLRRMAWGGLFDTLGGGFSRYSVDMKWHVPHFEKMLYDNAQLVSLYSDAYRQNGNPLYREVIEKTLKFVSRELTHAAGGCFSALDADSKNARGEQEEGAFYVWNKAELQELLEDDFALFADVFNINEFGYWENGNYVLIQNRPLDEIAVANNISIDELTRRKSQWENILYSARENRSRPDLDDKSLTSWNALMCKGYCDAFLAIDDTAYLEAGLKIAEFIQKNLMQSDGGLLRTWKNGRASINGYLEDYANTANAFVSLYHATQNPSWLERARGICDYCFEHFYDPEKGFFRFTSGKDSKLVAPHFEVEDNVIPASNSVLASVLFKLSQVFGLDEFEKTSRAMVANILSVADYPSAFGNWFDVLLDMTANTQVVVCGPGALQAVTRIRDCYRPGIFIAGSEIESKLPIFKNRFEQGQLLFYVCRDKVCSLPMRDIQTLLNHLNTDHD